VGKIKGKQMQVIIVLHDKDDDGKGTLKDKIEYTIFEKYNDGERPEDMINSPSVQVGSILSGFLKTIEKHGAYLGILPILESQEKDFDEGDFRKKIKNKDGNVIHVNLNRIKPKGNG
jgi:hypothetical protein